MRYSINYIYLFLSILLQSMAFMLSKLAASDLKESGFYLVVFNVYYIAAIICLGLQAVFWQLTLRKLDLSIAYPITALNNVFILLFSFFIFNESITFNNILGVSVIMLGVIILNFKSEIK
ncbi:EamA family transporter [Paenibacillus sp. NPDC058174]|uniref:EamA family transporter n=1 Tax=Paenibacillus sp. NPDC058174 TaxID=3346366 RepID=UPI0036DE29D7